VVPLLFTALNSVVRINVVRTSVTTPTNDVILFYASTFSQPKQVQHWLPSLAF
jgi:hypothetical protein